MLLGGFNGPNTSFAGLFLLSPLPIMTLLHDFVERRNFLVFVQCVFQEVWEYMAGFGGPCVL